MEGYALRVEGGPMMYELSASARRGRRKEADLGIRRCGVTANADYCAELKNKVSATIRTSTKKGFTAR